MFIQNNSKINVLLPITNNTNDPTQYIESLNIDEVKQDVENFLDFVKKIVRNLLIILITLLILHILLILLI